MADRKKREKKPAADKAAGLPGMEGEKQADQPEGFNPAVAGKDPATVAGPAIMPDPPKKAPLNAEKASAGASEGKAKGLKAVLDTPRPFGVHISGATGTLLHRFAKGKTLLTEEQEAFLLDSQYAKDHGAEVVYKKV